MHAYTYIYDIETFLVALFFVQVLLPFSYVLSRFWRGHFFSESMPNILSWGEVRNYYCECWVSKYMKRLLWQKRSKSKSRLVAMARLVSAAFPLEMFDSFTQRCLIEVDAAGCSHILLLWEWTAIQLPLYTTILLPSAADGMPTWPVCQSATLVPSPQTLAEWCVR